jgi:dolichol-phosphate mannosyltransferase
MISVVIPALNEGGNLAALHGELCTMAERASLDAEWIFVDDGSTDDTWKTLEKLAADDSRVVALRLRRNFGKSAAIAAGAKRARGDVICLLDADGQDVPDEIPALMERHRNHGGLVVGWRRPRSDALFKRVASGFFNGMVNGLTGMRLHDHNCGLKVLPRAFFEEVPLHGEMHRFIPLLARYRGFALDEKKVQHRKRRSGKSKYGARRYITGFLDLLVLSMLYGHRARLQHLLALVGVASLFLGGGMLLWMAGVWSTQFVDGIVYRTIANRPATFYGIAALLFGTQLLTLSALAALFLGPRTSRVEPYSITDEWPRRPES